MTRAWDETARDEARRKRVAMKGREVGPALRHSLSEACGCDVTEADHLPLDLSLRLRKAFFERMSKSTDVQKRNIEIDEKKALAAVLAKMAEAEDSARVLLFHCFDEWIGAVKIPARCVLLHPFEVWSVVQNDLALTTEDSTDGLCVEMNYYDLTERYHPEGIYEVTSWGRFERYDV